MDNFETSTAGKLIASGTKKTTDVIPLLSIYLFGDRVSRSPVSLSISYLAEGNTALVLLHPLLKCRDDRHAPRVA